MRWAGWSRGTSRSTRGCWKAGGERTDQVRLLVYGGWFGSGNVGDDAILIGLRNLFSETFPRAEIAALSMDVEQTRRVCGVEAFPLRSPRALLVPRETKRYLDVFRWADACILMGGTPVYDYDHASRIIHSMLPGIMAKELFCFGIGAKPIRSMLGRWVVRSLLRRSVAISTRDQRSMTELKSTGLDMDVRVTGDSALFLRPQTPDENRMKELGIPVDNPCVAICPRALSLDHRKHYHAPLSAEEISNIRRSLACLADHLAGSGYTPVFVPLHASPYDDDAGEISLITGMMREPSPQLDTIVSPEILAGLLSQMELVVGLRLHSLVLAAAAGTPIVGIDYDPKIRGFMESARVEEYLTVPHDPSEMLVVSTKRALDEKHDLKNRLLESCGGMRSKMMEEASRIKELVETKKK